MPVTAPQATDFNIVSMDTTYKDVISSPGMAGVAVFNANSAESVQHYYSIEDVANDYAPDTYAYQAANVYFTSPKATVFYVINYVKGGSSASDSSNNGAEVEQPDGSSKPLSGSSDNGSSTDPAVEALAKYYKCGAEFFVFEVTSAADEQTAIDLSNYVEQQQKGLLFLDQPTAKIATDNDFKWYAPIKENRSTVATSLTYSGDPSGYQFANAILAKYAGGNPASNLELTHDLPGVQPQDYYNFTPEDFKVYADNGFITYCYRNNRPVLSSGNSSSKYQVSDMVTRDYLNMHINSGLTDVMLKAHDAGKDIKFDQKGIDSVTSEIRLVLDSAVENQYIKDPSVGSVNINNIPAEDQERGILTGLQFGWSPDNNINGIRLHQVINVPLMNK